MIFLYVLTALFWRVYTQGGSTGCPNLYTLHPDYPNLCIHVESNLFSAWKHASCPSGGSLALPYNMGIHDFIITLLDTAETYYIGLNQTSYVLEWQDGGKFSGRFEVWGHSSGLSDGCIYYYYQSQWEWDITSCSNSKLYICQYVITNISPNVWVLGGALEGRVEIYHSKRWGTVTNINPPTSLGTVICSMLNLTFVDYNVTSVISDGTGPVWLDGVTCLSLPATIDECASVESMTWGHANASHTTDVKVRCQVPICNRDDLPSVTYAGQSCTGVTSINCTVTCVTLVNGDVYVHTNGLKSMTYTCSAVTGMWTPALPPLDCALSIASSSTGCMPATTTMTTTMTDTITMTTTQTLQPSQCIQPTVTSVQTLSLYAATQTDGYTQEISPSSVVYGTVQPTQAHVGVSPIPKYSKRSSAMFSTATKQDNRPSAIAIGSCGVLILAALLGSALFLDLITIGKERKKFQDFGETRKGHDRQRRSPDGGNSEDSTPVLVSGASSDISINEFDECPSEMNENLTNKEGLKIRGTAQVHPIPHGIKPEAFPLSVNLLDIPVANPYMPADVDTGYFAAFPSRPFIGDVMDIPSQFTYREPGESIKSMKADMEMTGFTNTRGVIPASPRPETLYDDH